MNVILQQDVPSLGRTGDIVRVKDGYARNYLVPRGLAAVADPRNVRRLSHQKRVAQHRAQRELAGARQLAEKLELSAVTIKRESNEEGKLFGSVTKRDIVEALAEVGFTIDRRQIQLDEPLRNIGVFTVPVKLHREVEGNAKVYVIYS